MTMPEMALRFILANADVRDDHSRDADARRTWRRTSPPATPARLPDDLIAQLRAHRWDRDADGVVAIGGARVHRAGRLNHHSRGWNDG